GEIRRIWDVGDRLGAVARCRTVGVGYLVRGDAIDEGQERAALVAVTGQGGQYRDAHFLGHVVGRGEGPFLAADTGAAIPQHEGTDPPEHLIDGDWITIDRGADKGIAVIARRARRRAAHGKREARNGCQRRWGVEY